MQNSQCHLSSNTVAYWVGVIFILVSAIGFSTKSIFVKLSYAYGVDAATLLALRMLLSMPVFLGCALWQSKADAASLQVDDWIRVTILGLLGYYLASYLDFLGLQYISAGLERLVLFLYPTLVLFLGAMFNNQIILSSQFVAVGLSYAGIVLVFASSSDAVSDGTYWGATLVFGSALSYAVYLVGSERLLASLGTMKFTAYAMSVSCLACIVQFVVTHRLADLHLPLIVYGYAFAMAMVSTVLPAFLVSEGIRRIGANRAALIATVGPVSTIVLAHLILDEIITLNQSLGTLLVIAGVVIVTTGK